MSDLFKGFQKCDITQCTITSFSAKKIIDIQYIMQKIDLFQTIFSPTAHGQITISDNSSLVQTLPLIGEELLSLTFQTPGRQQFDGQFWIHHVSDVQYSENGAEVSYILNFVEIDQQRAITTPVARGYNGQLSDAINDILKNKVKTKKTFDIEETKGIESTCIPHWNCWQTIEYLRNNACSKNYNSPYLFFQDQKGYHFKTYEQLAKDRNSSQNNIVFTSEAYMPDAGEQPGKSTVLKRQYRNISQLSTNKQAHTSFLINHGGISHRTLLFDVLNKTTKTIDNNYQDLKSQIKQPFNDKFYDTHTANFTNVGVIPTVQTFDSLDTTNFSENPAVAGFKQLFVKNLTETEVGFTTPGDSELAPGDMITIQMPKRVNNLENDKITSGKYMIGSLKHGIMNGQMLSTLECYRIGAQEQVI